MRWQNCINWLFIDMVLIPSLPRFSIRIYFKKMEENELSSVIIQIIHNVIVENFHLNAHTIGFRIWEFPTFTGI